MARLALRFLLSILIFVVTAEVVVRVANPTVRHQVVRQSEGLTLYEAHGQPVWEEGQSAERRHLQCPIDNPEAAITLTLGSSIFYGSGVEPADVFTQDLQEAYGTTRCVMNFAEPGFSMQNKLARAQEVLSSYPGADVLLEIWENDPHGYTMLGRSAYSLRTLPVDSGGYPRTLGVPAPLNGFLFRHSKAYEYASLAVDAPPNPRSEDELWREIVVPQLDEMLALVRANGSSLRLMFMSKLSRPLNEQLGDGAYAAYPVARDWADRHGISWFEAAELLQDQAVEEIRYDPCCHFNPKGHEVLAERLLPLLPR